MNLDPLVVDMVVKFFFVNLVATLALLVGSYHLGKAMLRGLAWLEAKSNPAPKSSAHGRDSRAQP